MKLTAKSSYLALALGLATPVTHAVKTPQIEDFFNNQRLYAQIEQWNTLFNNQQQEFIDALHNLAASLSSVTKCLRENNQTEALQIVDFLPGISQEKLAMQQEKAKKKNPYIF